MKKFFSYLFFTLATAIPALSQVSNSTKYDFNLTLPSLERNQGLSGWQETIPSIGFLDNSVNFRQLDSLSDLGKINKNNSQLLYRKDENEIIMNTDPVYSLRIVTPGGNQPIQIYEPDSTKNYTLLIKEFN